MTALGPVSATRAAQHQPLNGAIKRALAISRSGQAEVTSGIRRENEQLRKAQQDAGTDPQRGANLDVLA